MPNNPKPVFTTDSDTASLISNSNVAQDILALRGTSNSVPNKVFNTHPFLKLAKIIF